MSTSRGRKAGTQAGRGIRKPPAEAPRRAAPETGEESHLDWSRKNFLLLGAGGAAILIGFVLLALGDITFAPLLLVGGYIVLIPWGIVARGDRSGRGATGGRTSSPGTND
ncbi:MAG: hypothetical protein ACE15D_00615 [Candidatus Eisenbacteria bacterium]|nr:hypothetical protein [Candidatus Eisenbacteria bacterium]